MSVNTSHVRGLRPLVMVMTFSYPITLHLAIINGFLQLAVWILLAIAVAHSLLILNSSKRKLTDLFPPSVAALAVICLLLKIETALYLPPVLISSLLFYLFGRTLLPGQEPLITRIARRMGDNDLPHRRYTHVLTWVWTLFFAAILIESVLLALFATIEVWSLFTNFINYLLILVLFLLDYLVFRVIYFHRPPSLNAVRRVLRERNLQRIVRD